MGDCLRLQVRNGEWFANDGKTKRKSSQYFEVTRSSDFLLFRCPQCQRRKPVQIFCAFPESGVPWQDALVWRHCLFTELFKKRADV